MIKLISPGEIVPGTRLMVYESCSFHRYMCPISNQIKEQVLTDYHPWFKGIPYEVVSVAGPIVAVRTNCFQNAPPVVFIDSRFVKFVEVSEEFLNTYNASMGLVEGKNVDKLPPKSQVYSGSVIFNNYSI